MTLIKLALVVLLFFGGAHVIGQMESSNTTTIQTQTATPAVNESPQQESNIRIKDITGDQTKLNANVQTFEPMQCVLSCNQ